MRAERSGSADRLTSERSVHGCRVMIGASVWSFESWGNTSSDVTHILPSPPPFDGVTCLEKGKLPIRSWMKCELQIRA